MFSRLSAFRLMADSYWFVFVSVGGETWTLCVTSRESSKSVIWERLFICPCPTHINLFLIVEILRKLHFCQSFLPANIAACYIYYRFFSRDFTAPIVSRLIRHGTHHSRCFHLFAPFFCLLIRIRRASDRGV